METRETILQELESISPAVANLSRANVFAVPAGYFSQLPQAILSRIQLENQERKSPYDVPPGYFDELPLFILNKVKSSQQSVSEELNELAPLLNTISKQPVYKVPDGYFESLELTVPLKLAKPSAKVFSFGNTKRWMQYAVAASVAAVLMIGAYLFIGNGSNESYTNSISYSKALNMDVNEELSNVNVNEIDQYLQESPSMGYAINAVLSSPEEIDVQQNINSTSEDEIMEFLKDSVSTEAVANGI